MMKLSEIIEEARVSYDNGHYSKAIQYYQKALKFKLPSSMTIPLKIELAINFEHNRDFTLAIETLNGLLSEDTSVENKYYIYSTLAYCSYDIKDYKNASLNYDEVFKYSDDEGERAEVLLMSGKSLYFLGQLVEAEEKFINSAKYKKHFSTKDSFTYYYYYSMIKIFQEKVRGIKDLISNIKEFCKTDDEWAMNYHALSEYNFLVKDYDKLFSATNTAIKYEWNKKYLEDKLLYFLGICYKEKNNNDQYNKIIERLEKDYPQSKYLVKLSVNV